MLAVSLLDIFKLLALVNFGSSNQDAKRLYATLLHPDRYQNYIRPAENKEAIVSIRIGLRLSQILDVDEKKEIIALNVWLLQEWLDPRLSWDPLEYSNLTSFNVPAYAIWKPDIVLYNNADGDYTVTLMTPASLTHEGRVKWEPPATYRSQCHINVKYFPFDEQICQLKFGAWTYGIGMVDLQHWFQPHNDTDEFALRSKAIDLKKYFGNDEWDLLEVYSQKNVVGYPCCKDPYVDITFHIKLRRKTHFYVVNFLTPCIAINSLTFVIFYLPADCGEKIALSIFILLSLSVFQLLLIEIMPPTSLTIPLLGKYILFTTIIVSMSVACSVLVLNTHYRSQKQHDMPFVVRKIFLQYLPRLFRMRRPQRKRFRGGSSRDWTSRQCDLSNYDNPYKSKFKPLLHLKNSSSSESLRLSSTFIGLSDTSLRCCDVCGDSLSRRRHVPERAQKAIDGACFIASHMQLEFHYCKVKEDWRYMAQVVDRLLLIIYIIGCIVGTFCILLNAPVISNTAKSK